MSNQLNTKALAQKIKQDIDKFCVDKWNKGPRNHLGASQIGYSCKRYLWLLFRWCDYKVHDARQYRLFQRGHFEEPRFKMYLEGAGWQVQEFAKALFYHPKSDSYLIEDVDYNIKNIGDAQFCINVTNELIHIEKAKEQGVICDKGKMQIRISACKSHFGGSVDGIAKHPDFNLKFLAEYKTHGTGLKFNNLVKNACELEKYVYFCQQCIYGYKLDLNYSIFLTVNKNDDDIYAEVIELNHKLGKELEDKAEEIIFSQTSPEPASLSKDSYDCRYCDFKDVCYGSKPILKNCRSCKKCLPVDNAEWYCSLYQQIIPKEYISLGCQEWYSILL